MRKEHSQHTMTQVVNDITRECLCGVIGGWMHRGRVVVGSGDWPHQLGNTCKIWSFSRFPEDFLVLTRGSIFGIWNPAMTSGDDGDRTPPPSPRIGITVSEVSCEFRAKEEAKEGSSIGSLWRSMGPRSRIPRPGCHVWRWYQLWLRNVGTGIGRLHNERIGLMKTEQCTHSESGSDVGWGKEEVSN